MGGGGGIGVGTSVGSLISAGEVTAFIGDQGALKSSLYLRIVLIKVNN